MKYVRLTWAAFDKAPASFGGASPVVGQGSARPGDKAPASPAGVTRRDKPKIRPEFPILNRPIRYSSHMRQPWRGAKVTGRTASPSRVRESRHTVIQYILDDVRGSPSCTGVGGVESRKRGTDLSGCQARGLTVSEAHRRVPASCPFLSGGRHAPIRAPTTTLVIPHRRLKPCRPLIRPTCSGFTPLRLRDPGSERVEMPLPTGLADSRGQFRPG